MFYHITLEGARYLLSIIDDYSKMTWVFMMKQKSKAFKCIMHWAILMKNQTGKTKKCFRTDNDLEFYSMEFNEFFKDEGIARQHIVCYTPRPNGVIERMKKKPCWKGPYA